tara:strand:- start:239 stop:763 length:525 start_codon:yes stop_codon:yes gene_type:complete
MDPVYINKLYDYTFNKKNKNILLKKYKKLIKFNEKKFLEVFRENDKQVSKLLKINNIDIYIEFLIDNMNEICHNDFHKENIMRRREKDYIIDFEMLFLHRSNKIIDIINYFRDCDIYTLKRLINLLNIDTEKWNFIVRFIAIKNLIVLEYLRSKRGWDIAGEQAKFIRIFRQRE